MLLASKTVRLVMFAVRQLLLGEFSEGPNKDSFNEGTKLKLEPPKYTFLNDCY